MIVTIDGPAGAGKSSAAKALAKRLAFEFLDTGAMYRAVTLAGLQNTCDFSDQLAVNALLNDISIELPPGKVLLNGADVTDAIRKPAVTDASGQVANNSEVRHKLVELQRLIAQDRDMVCEGRDQGTIVFPTAECKFFLIADPKERARRRFEELKEKGEEVSLEDIYSAQQARDERDAQRDIAPMVPAPDAHIVDSTHLTLSQVVDALEQEVRQCMKA